MGRVDPNNTFVTRVTVLSGDARSDQQSDFPLTMEDDARPDSPARLFTGDVSACATSPGTWAVMVPLRGLTPGEEVTTPPPSTGIPAVDAFLRTVGLARTTITTTPGEPMQPGARFAFQFKVTYRTSFTGPDVSTFYPIRYMTDGPTNGRINFDTVQLNTGEAGTDVNLRLSQPAPHRLSVRCYSDPDGVAEVPRNGQPVTSVAFEQNESVLPVRVRATRSVGPNEVFTLYAKASGSHNATANVNR